MEPFAILRADRLDLLFENRNKDYGAYPLRKFYGRRLATAVALMLLLVIIFCALVLWNESRRHFVRQIFLSPDIYLGSVVPVNPPARLIQPAKPSRPAKPAATAALTNLLIVRNQPVTQTIATVDEIEKSAIGSHTLTGPDLEPGDNSHAGVPAAAGVAAGDSVDLVPSVYEHADVMPEFPGGPEALKRFLLKNLRMPETSLGPGSQVKVIARFVVGADGKVGGIETVLSGGGLYDKEVKRVIYRMPDWKPGIQNHKKVAVYFSLPVFFVVPDEN